MNEEIVCNVSFLFNLRIDEIEKRAFIWIICCIICFFSSLKKYPDKTAVMDGVTSLTFEQLSLRAGYLAEQLKEHGIKRGDRVVFYLDHNIDQAVAILAVSSVGGVFVPVSFLLYPEQILHIIKNSECRFLITTEKKIQVLEDGLDECPALEHVLYTGGDQKDIHLQRTSLVIENDLAALLYTSGSTGTPKGVMITHRNLVAGCHIVSEYLGLTESDRLLGVLQLSFDYGLNQLITMLALGGPIGFSGIHFRMTL